MFGRGESTRLDFLGGGQTVEAHNRTILDISFLKTDLHAIQSHTSKATRLRSDSNEAALDAVFLPMAEIVLKLDCLRGQIGREMPMLTDSALYQAKHIFFVSSNSTSSTAVCTKHSIRLRSDDHGNLRCPVCENISNQKSQGRRGRH